MRALCILITSAVSTLAAAQTTLNGSEVANLHFATYYNTSLILPEDQSKFFELEWNTKPEIIEWKVDFDRGVIFVGRITEGAGVTKHLLPFESANKSIDYRGAGDWLVKYTFKFEHQAFLEFEMTEYKCGISTCGQRVEVEAGDHAVAFMKAEALEYHTSYYIPVAKWPFDLFEFHEMASQE